jgi:hypothetical protein
LWVIVGTSLLFALSVLVGLAIAAVLGRIGREISELLESDHWASAQLTRDVDEEAGQEGASEAAVASSATPLAAGQHR